MAMTIQRTSNETDDVCRIAVFRVIHRYPGSSYVALIAHRPHELTKDTKASSTNSYKKGTNPTFSPFQRHRYHFHLNANHVAQAYQKQKLGTRTRVSMLSTSHLHVDYSDIEVALPVHDNKDKENTPFPFGEAVCPFLLGPSGALRVAFVQLLPLFQALQLSVPFS